MCENFQNFENCNTFGRHNKHNFRSNRQALARRWRPNWHISTARPLHFEIMYRSEATGHWFRSDTLMNTVRAIAPVYRKCGISLNSKIEISHLGLSKSGISILS